MVIDTWAIKKSTNQKQSADRTQGTVTACEHFQLQTIRRKRYINYTQFRYSNHLYYIAIYRWSVYRPAGNVIILTSPCKISITHPKQTPIARFRAISPAALRDLTSWNTSKQIDVNPKRNVSANLLRSKSLNILSQFRSTSSPSFILQQRWPSTHARRT